jgi:hypothetical protein
MLRTGALWRWMIGALLTLSLWPAINPCRGASGPGRMPSVQVVESWPASPASLAPRDQVHLRVAYESTGGLRFQASGYRAGEAVQAVMHNPSPVYAPGAGEAIVWLAYEQGAELDEVRVVVHDPNWKKILEVPVPVQFDWNAPRGAVSSPMPSWVAELNRTQQQAISASGRSHGESSDGAGSMILWQLLFWTVPGYFPLQGFVLWRCWRRRRAAALLPLLVTIPALVISIVALVQGSNLWPIWLILLTPPCFLYLVGVLLWPGGGAKAQAS